MSHDEVDELWSELIHDSKALDYLKTAADLSDIDEEKHKERLKNTTLNHSPKKYWWLSAAVVLIAGLFFGFQIAKEPGESVQPVDNIELNYYRSADGSSGDKEISREAIELANQGKYNMAVRMIDVELNRTDDLHTKSLLLLQSGSILYNTGRYREALFRFDRITKNPDVRLLIQERAYWYLGNTYFQLGKPESAKAAFQNAYDLNGAYSRVAEKYLTAMGEE